MFAYGFEQTDLIWERSLLYELMYREDVLPKPARLSRSKLSATFEM